MHSRDYYTASKLTAQQAGKIDSWQFPSVAKKISLENKNLLPADFDLERQELERQIETAKKLGFEQGFADGKAKGIALLTEKAKIFEGLLLGFETGITGLDFIFEEHMVKLASVIAKTVIRHELKTYPEQILAVVKEAFSCLPNNTEGIKLHLHQEDIALIQETVDSQVFANLKNINFVADPGITRGGCILEADSSYINASLETRLAAVLADVAIQTVEPLTNES